MPIYEYQCTSCENRFEVMQRMADDPITVCETCGSPVKKLLSAPSFQFKGSGWYVTDYAQKDGAKKDEAKDGTKDGESAQNGAGEKKADSKKSDNSSSGGTGDAGATSSGTASSSASTKKGAQPK